MRIQLQDLGDRLEFIGSCSVVHTVHELWTLAEAFCEPLINPWPYLLNPETWREYGDALGGQYDRDTLSITDPCNVYPHYYRLILSRIFHPTYLFYFEPGTLSRKIRKLFHGSIKPNSEAGLHLDTYISFAADDWTYLARKTTSKPEWVKQFSPYWQAILLFHTDRQASNTLDTIKAAWATEPKKSKKRHLLLMWWECVLNQKPTVPQEALDAVLAATESMLDDLQHPCYFRGSGRLPVSTWRNDDNTNPQELLEQIREARGSVNTVNERDALRALTERLIGASAVNAPLPLVPEGGYLRAAVLQGDPGWRIQVLNVIEALVGYAELHSFPATPVQEQLEALALLARTWTSDASIAEEAEIGQGDLLAFWHLDAGGEYRRPVVDLLTLQRVADKPADCPVHVALSLEDANDDLALTMRSLSFTCVEVDCGASTAPVEGIGLRLDSEGSIIGLTFEGREIQITGSTANAFRLLTIAKNHSTNDTFPLNDPDLNVSKAKSELAELLELGAGARFAEKVMNTPRDSGTAAFTVPIRVIDAVTPPPLRSK